MVEIISKRDGERREDGRARKVIERNWGTIERIADQISGGSYSARKRSLQSAHQETAAGSGSTIIHASAPRVASGERPYVRVSPNRRVVVVDEETNRQLHFLGEIRRVDGVARFVLATAANGFFAPLDAEVAAGLEGLDGAPLDADRDEAVLAAEIADALGITR